MRERLRALHAEAALQRQLLADAERVFAAAQGAVGAAQASVEAYNDDAEAAANALRAGLPFTELTPGTLANAELRRRSELLVATLQRAATTLGQDVAIKRAALATAIREIATEAGKVVVDVATSLSDRLIELETEARDLRWSLEAVAHTWVNGRPIPLTDRAVRVLTERLDQDDRLRSRERAATWQAFLDRLISDPDAEPPNDLDGAPIPPYVPVANPRWEDRPQAVRVRLGG